MKPPKPPQPPKPSQRSGKAHRILAAALHRSRAELVPPAFQFLWGNPRFLVAYGGRASAKSWSIARVLLALAYEQPLRVLCCREIQSSVRESAYRLLADQVRMLQLDEHFDIRADSIAGHNGSEFIFEGLRYNISRLRSLEGVNLCWIEEAQAVSERSWEDLIPTIRKKGSRFFISFNPTQPDDPVAKRFVESGRTDVIARKVSWRDNPYLSAEAIAEKDWLQRTDIDAYRHVWEGEPRTVSDALILKGKYYVEPFAVSEAWAGPYHGLDYGFSRDPSAAVRCYINDQTRTLYVDAEYWALGADIDALPGALEAAIPGIARHVVYADSARPESTSYLARNGIPNARSAEKWPGSVDDGIAYLRSFARVVIAPSCRHLLDECGRYSFKTDRLTGVPLPEPVDAHNHLIDALRYALSPLIRNQPAGGFFNRAALLVDGEPVEPEVDRKDRRPARIYATVAIGEGAGGAVGLIYWAVSPHCGYTLRVLDYELVEIEEALDITWLMRVFARAQELRREWDAAEELTRVMCEEGQLYRALGAVLISYHRGHPLVSRPAYDLVRVESRKLPPTLDERADKIRTAVNGGRECKVARSAYVRQTTYRSESPSNHLMGQVLGYRPGVPAQAVAAAFCLGCVLGLDERRPRATDVDSASLAVPPAEPAVQAPPRPRPPPAQPTALLKPGRRIIDGVAVDVPPAPDGRALVWFPLAAGFHIVDGIGVLVDDPRASIHIPLSDLV